MQTVFDAHVDPALVDRSLAGTTLEKRSLEVRRAVSRQYYRLEILQEQRAGKRVLAQQLGAPNRLLGRLDEAAQQDQAAKPAKPRPSTKRKPGNKSQPRRDASP